MIEIVLIAALVIIGSIVIWRNLGGVLQTRLQEVCVAVAGDATRCGTK